MKMRIGLNRANLGTCDHMMSLCVYVWGGGRSRSMLGRRRGVGLGDWAILGWVVGVVVGVGVW